MKSWKNKPVGKLTLGFEDSLKRRIIGDLHFGEPGADVELFEKLLEDARDQNRKVILLGDLITSIIPDDKRFEIETHAESFAEQQDYLNGILDKYHDIVELVFMGNHEGKLIKKHGDFLEKMCKRHGINYAGFRCNILYEKDTNQFNVLYTHGDKTFNYRAGEEVRKQTNKRIRLKDILGNGIEADMYVQGHAHEGVMYTDPFTLYMVNEDGERYEERYLQTGEGKTYVCIPALLRGHQHESYASRSGYAPTEVGCVDLEWDEDLNIKDLEIKVSKGDDFGTKESYADRRSVVEDDKMV